MRSKTLHTDDHPLQCTQSYPKPLQILPPNHEPRNLPRNWNHKNPYTIQHYTCPLPARCPSFPYSPQGSPDKTWQKNLLHSMLPPWTFLKGLSLLSMPLLLFNMTQTWQNQCLNNPKYSGPTPIKQESPSPPPFQVLPPWTIKKPCFSPNQQSSNSSSSSNGISKRGWKGKKPEWKKFRDNVDKSLTREFQEMDRKYDQELKEFSIAFDYQEQYDDTAYNNIDGEPSYSQNFWFSNGISNITRG